MPSHDFRTEGVIQGEPKRGCGACIQVDRAIAERSAQELPDLHMGPLVCSVPYLDIHPDLECRDPTIDISRLKDGGESLLSVQKQGQSELALGHLECG